MAQTYFFYDLETTGIDPRNDRIMQFAGIRSDMDLNPIGESHNVLVRLSDDTLPSPEAIMVTGITPQQTQADGLSEAEFAKFFVEEIATPGTIMTGFNSIRFDDEFMRYHLWRNFHDPYEWCWKDGRSRWDLLDVVRMTRALRPEGIRWPVVDGKAVNKLELITKENGIDHYKAHDALSDVEALIAVSTLIRDKQPQLYEYLLSMRDKNKIKALVNLDDKKPFVYVSGRYDAEFNKATIAFPLTAGRNGNVLVYDLRYDPASVVDLSVDEIKSRMFATWEERQQEGFVKVPVKEMMYNRAPAIAPLGVLSQADGWAKIRLNQATIETHMQTLLAKPHFAENVRTAIQSRPEFPMSPDAEAQLYNSFVPDRDKIRIEAVRNADARRLADFNPEFSDERLAPLLLHYKARNYPSSLSSEEVVLWDAWRGDRLRSKLPAYLKSLESLSMSAKSNAETYILQELQLWAEGILPTAE